MLFKRKEKILTENSEKHIMLIALWFVSLFAPFATVTTTFSDPFVLFSSYHVVFVFISGTDGLLFWGIVLFLYLIIAVMEYKRKNVVYILYPIFSIIVAVIMIAIVGQTFESAPSNTTITIWFIGEMLLLVSLIILPIDFYNSRKKQGKRIHKEQEEQRIQEELISQGYEVPKKPKRKLTFNELVSVGAVLSIGFIYLYFKFFS